MKRKSEDAGVDEVVMKMGGVKASSPPEEWGENGCKNPTTKGKDTAVWEIHGKPSAPPGQLSVR